MSARWISACGRRGAVRRGRRRDMRVRARRCRWSRRGAGMSGRWLVRWRSRAGAVLTDGQSSDSPLWCVRGRRFAKASSVRTLLHGPFPTPLLYARFLPPRRFHHCQHTETPHPKCPPLDATPGGRSTAVRVSRVHSSFLRCTRSNTEHVRSRRWPVFMHAASCLHAMESTLTEGGDGYPRIRDRWWGSTLQI